MHSVRCLGLSLSYKNIADWNNDYDESDTIDNNDNVGVNIILWKLQGPVIYSQTAVLRKQWASGILFKRFELTKEMSLHY